MPKAVRRRVLVVTGSRAEFGLLRPVIDGLRARKDVTALLAAGGSHLLAPARTVREVASAYAIDARVPMQRAGHATRADDALAVARGVDGFTRAIAKLRPDWVVVLGDRIEAFAAAVAGSIAGVGVCHIHGGDRAEGIADEAMRHAITKLAHLHCCATASSGERVIKLGEPPETVHVTGSPAIDGLSEIQPMSDADAAPFGDPQTVVLLHPSGLPAARERAMVYAMVCAVDEMSAGDVICLAPNADAGGAIIREALEHRCALSGRIVRYTWRADKPAAVAEQKGRDRGDASPRLWTFVEHLPRELFLSLLKRMAASERDVGLMIGNSSAGLIEAAALGMRVVNIGPRQDGRERCENVVDCPEAELGILGSKVDWALSLDREGFGTHPYGDGNAGARIAALLAKTDPATWIRKRNTF
jgi:UDP-hydrolysing UDP-N-acetyl-D-glucosamine 2-epimerase